MMMEEEILFRPGDVIVPISSGPFVKTLFDKGRSCDNCLIPRFDQLRRCKGGCLRMFYCDEVCEEEDWEEGHSVECKSILFRLFRDEDRGRLFDGVLRMLAKYHLKPDSFTEKRTVAGVPHRSIADLLSDVDLGGTTTPPEVSKLFKELKGDPSFKNIEFDEELLRKMSQVWKSNSFPLINEIPEMIHVELGLGLYTGKPAGAKHACRPNAVRIGLLDKMELRCIHPIKKGEEPTISYMVKNHNLPTREFILRKHYDLSCDCELCTLERRFRPAVDYEQLEHLEYEKLHGERRSGGGRYQSMLEIRDELLALYRKLYHEYDKRITWFCFAVFGMLCNLEGMEKGTVPKPVLQREAEGLAKRMKITFGKESHYFTTSFMRPVRQAGILLQDDNDQN